MCNKKRVWCELFSSGERDLMTTRLVASVDASLPTRQGCHSGDVNLHVISHLSLMQPLQPLLNYRRRYPILYV